MREHSLQKISAVLCLGHREAEEATVAVRRFGSKARTVMPIEGFSEQLGLEIEEEQVFDAQAASSKSNYKYGFKHYP